MEHPKYGMMVETASLPKEGEPKPPITIDDLARHILAAADTHQSSWSPTRKKYVVGYHRAAEMSCPPETLELVYAILSSAGDQAIYWANERLGH